MWYELIRLEPYAGSAESDVLALVETLNMNVYFDDVDCRSCRFCFKLDAESPIVDYDIGWDELEAWFRGEVGLVLEAFEHDPSRFSSDLYFPDED